MPIQPRTTLHINAPPEIVWQVLSDFEAYARWTEQLHFQGSPGQGDRLKITVKLFRWKVSVPVQVETLAPLKELRWRGGPRLIMSGSHFFQLRSAGPGQTEVIHGEDFTGLLLPVLWFFLSREVLAFYDRINADLKKHAETLAQSEAEAQAHIQA